MKNPSLDKTILSIRNLSVAFETDSGLVQVLNDVNFDLEKGQSLGIVGESGCGKTVTAMSILKLLPCPSAKILSGKIIFEGIDLLAISEKKLAKIRGNRISFIFQEPMTALNPVMTVGKQLAEVFTIHKNIAYSEIYKASLSLLSAVGITQPEKTFSDYPHQLSGGMRQRIMIAMAIALKPEIIIADEPTTALDVTIQSQIINLLLDLKEQYNTSIIFITHDLGVISQISEKVIVLYGGEIVEKQVTNELFNKPLHPYTKGLINSIPSLKHPHKQTLFSMTGNVEEKYNFSRCPFFNRCPEKIDKCSSYNGMINLDNRTEVRCLLYRGAL